MTQPGAPPPENLPVPARRLSSPLMAEAFRTIAERPTDPEGHTHPAPLEVQDEPPRSQRDPAAERRSTRFAVACFVVSMLGSCLFMAAYEGVPTQLMLGLLQNVLLGTGLGLTMLGIGMGCVVIGRRLTPEVKSVQHRPEHHSPPEDEQAAEQEFIGGFTELGLSTRKLLRRSMLGALGLMPLPFVFALKDLGPRPGMRLFRNSWTKDALLLDSDTLKPVHVGDIDVGGIMTVLPQGHTDTSAPVNAESIVVLIRLPPGVNQPLPGRESWAPADHVAYSKICTHAGCPVSLYEEQDYLLLCPCHQSTYDVPRGCHVQFGPAPRPLPQLPIYIDKKGYFRAQRPFDVPLGPTFWERSGPSNGSQRPVNPPS